MLALELGAALALLAGAPASAEDAPGARAAGGVRIVEAAEAAPATVVGSVGEVRALDRHGRAARLEVSRSLRGPLERGDEVEVAWEELAAARAPRFEPGERILVSLEALPGHSIWRTRLTDPEQRARTLALAMAGGAFLREPAEGTLDALGHYLWLAREQREGATGAGYLVALASRAEPPVAADAVARLATHAQLAEEIDAGLGRGLVRALVRDDGDATLRRALVELIAGHDLRATRPELERLAAGDPPAPPEVFEALARLDGGLAPERGAALLASAPAAQRRVAVRHLRGPEAEATLASALRGDPAPEVRVAAAERLAELSGEGALEPLLGALSDAEQPVRGAAARLLAGLGAPATAPLSQVAAGNDAEAATAAVVGLGLSSDPRAREVLEGIASGDPHSRLGRLAALALGEGLGERH